MYGSILTVEVAYEGVVAHSWATAMREATEDVPAHFPMEVDSAIDLDPQGGMLEMPDGTQVVYLGFTEGGEDGVDPEEVATEEGTVYEPDIVWMGTAGPAGGIQDDMILRCWPLAPETIAQVQLHDTDATLVEAVVAHALRPQIPEGPREPAESESVVVVPVGGQLTVTEVLARRAQVRRDMVEDLDETLADLQGRLDTSAEALEAAKVDLDRRTKANEEALTDPALAAKVAALVGDFSDLFATKVTAKMLNVDEALAQKLQAVIATFQSVFAGTIVADMIQLDTLAGKVLNGVDVYSPHVDSFPQVHIGGSVIETKREIAEDDGIKRAVTGISFGGDTADKMQLLKPDGSVLAGFDSSGNGTAADLDVNGVLRVGGSTLDELLWQLPRGLVGRNEMAFGASSNGYHFGSTELGIGEVMFDSAKGRMFKVSFYGRVQVLAPGWVTLRFRGTSTPGYDTIPASPSVSGTASPSPEWQIATIRCPQVGIYSFYMESYSGDYGGNYRVLLTAQGSDGAHGYVLAHDNWPNQFTVHDVGPYLEEGDGQSNMGGGTQYQAPAPAPVVTTPPKKTYTSVWQATGVATYREGVGSVSTSRYLLQQGTYGGKNRWSHVVFNGGAISGETGKTIAQSAGAPGSTVTKVEFYGLVKATYWDAGGTAVLAPATQTALTSIPTSSGESRFGQWKAGTAKWVTLYNALGNRVRSVAIGPNGSGTVEYIKFDPAYSNLKLRITYIR